MCGEGDEVAACASVAETRRAILGVSKQRQALLDRKGNPDKGYRLMPEERSDMANTVRDEFEMTEEQLVLQLRDQQDCMDALELPSSQLALPSSKLGAKPQRQAAGGAAQPTDRRGMGEGARESTCSWH